MINLVRWPAGQRRVVQQWQLGPIDFLERPVAGIRSPLRDPAFEQLDLLGTELLLLIGRRHPDVGVVADESLNQSTRLRLATHDDRLVTFREEARFDIEAQISRPLAGIGTVTREARIREDRTNVAVEVDFCGVAGDCRISGSSERSERPDENGQRECRAEHCGRLPSERSRVSIEVG